MSQARPHLPSTGPCRPQVVLVLQREVVPAARLFLLRALEQDLNAEPTPHGFIPRVCDHTCCQASHVLPAPALLFDLGVLADPAWGLLPATTASLRKLSSSRLGLLLFNTLREKVARRRKPWFGPGPARGAGRIRGAANGAVRGAGRSRPGWSAGPWTLHTSQRCSLHPELRGVSESFGSVSHPGMLQSLTAAVTMAPGRARELVTVDGAQPVYFLNGPSTSLC